jgi:3-oxoacyl-[acyl-carrier-protein] synthase-3
MKAFVKAIEYYLPDGILDNDELARDFPEWNAEKIETKTGIRQRHMAAHGECASDMAVAAAKKILASGACQPEEIDYILLCTQSPDYILPTTACVLQQRLGLFGAGECLAW